MCPVCAPFTLALVAVSALRCTRQTEEDMSTTRRHKSAVLTPRCTDHATKYNRITPALVVTPCQPPHGQPASLRTRLCSSSVNATGRRRGGPGPTRGRGWRAPHAQASRIQAGRRHAGTHIRDGKTFCDMALHDGLPRRGPPPPSASELSHFDFFFRMHCAELVVRGRCRLSASGRVRC